MQLYLENLHGQSLHTPPGQLVPLLDCPQVEVFLLISSLDFPCFNLSLMSLIPSLCVTVKSLAPSSSNLLSPTEPSLPQAEQAQGKHVSLCMT